jgi:hypothetical protein
MPGLEHREIQVNHWCVGENTVLHDGDSLAECIQGKMQGRGPLCRLRIENKVHEALLELEEGVGQAQLVDAQGLLGAIPSDEMFEEDRQIRRRCPRVIVQGVGRSDDRRWQTFFSQGPVAGSPRPDVIFRSTPPCTWYTHAALTMPCRLFEDLTVCWTYRTERAISGNKALTWHAHSKSAKMV